MPACDLGLQKHLFRYSLKIPACMIIFKILFSQKHCTLYLYSNGHIWIPIYEFEICVSVKKHANRTPTFGNGFGIQKRLQKAVQVSSILPWTSQGKNICFTELFVTILKRVVKWAKNNLLQHVPAFVFILKWKKKTSLHFEIISFINIYKNSPIKGWGGLSKMSNKMSKMSIIELSRLGQDLFDFSGLTWAHPLTYPSTHR